MPKPIKKFSQIHKPKERPGVTIEDLIRWTVSYPFECAQTLMKIGYEPIAPHPEKFLGIFGKTSLALPNSISYVRYMISIDELGGCYRGWAPTMIQRISTNLLTKYLDSIYKSQWDENFPPANISSNLKLTCNSKSPPEIGDILMTTSWKMVTTSISTLISHPLYVITIRMVAQFVGREKRYMSFLSTLRTILYEEGIFGFFRGFVPRLLSENIKILCPALVFLLITRFCQNRLLVNTTTGVTMFLTERLVYQLDVVAATMAIENSSMAIGKAPFLTKKFLWWGNCWEHLRRLNVHNRGRSSFFRYYNGPTTMINGQLKPTIVYFGPSYPLKPSHFNL